MTSPISLPELADRYRQMDLFRSIPPAVLLELAEKTEIIALPADMPVFQKNDPGDALYLLLNGAAKVHDESYTVSTLETGACFGELALLDAGPRSMSVSAITDAVLARIDRVVFFEVVSDHPGLMQPVISLLINRLRSQTDQTVGYLRRRESELTALVEERTAELKRQKEQAEAEKREAEFQRRRAEQSEKAEQQFLANMSHEIRTPMNAVMGMTRLLLQKNPREDQLKYLHSIRQSSEALLVILNDILDLSKIQAGRLELEWTELNLREIIENVEATLQFRAEEKGLTLAINYDPQVPALMRGDPVRLQQILLNLAGNAVKFTESGKVEIIARVVSLNDQKATIALTVKDTGIGMSPEQVNTVFESFRQASLDITRKYGGTGLGLSISKQLVELFGGEIGVKSELGRGSEFEVVLTLDILQQPHGTVNPANSVSTEALRGLRVLLAEDNAFNRIVAVETLELLVPEIAIDTAENGLEAVKKVKEKTFDVILMDVSMPEMDGLEATTIIRAMPPPTGNIPIIAFTASVTQQETGRCLQAGMNLCVPKPFQEAELLRALYTVTRGETETPAELSLEGLKNLAGNNPDRMAKYLTMFLQSSASGKEKIKLALEKEDGTMLHRAIHTLKPQLRLVGAEPQAEEAQLLEDNLREGEQPATLADRIQLWLLEVNKVEEAIKLIIFP